MEFNFLGKRLERSQHQYLVIGGGASGNGYEFGFTEHKELAPGTDTMITCLKKVLQVCTV